MGWQPEPRTYRLVFADPAMGGLEVVAGSVTVGEFMEMTGWDESQALNGATLPDGAPIRPSLLAKFADSLVSWNLGPGSKPLPATLKTLRGLDVALVREMVRAWLEAVSGVSGPLGRPSGDGQLSPEASLNLAGSSASLPG